jgi:hypothetical protein
LNLGASETTGRSIPVASYRFGMETFDPQYVEPNSPRATVHDLSPIFNHTFSLNLISCKAKSFYVPKVRIPPNQRTDLICFGAKEMVDARDVKALLI